MGRVGPTWVRIGSVLVLYCTEMDSRENRYVSDQPEMDSGWDRYGLALARHGCVREPSCIGAVRYGIEMVPLWLCIAPNWIRARVVLDQINPIWIRAVLVLGRQ